MSPVHLDRHVIRPIFPSETKPARTAPTFIPPSRARLPESRDHEHTDIHTHAHTHAHRRGQFLSTASARGSSEPCQNCIVARWCVIDPAAAQTPIPSQLSAPGHILLDPPRQAHKRRNATQTCTHACMIETSLKCKIWIVFPSGAGRSHRAYTYNPHFSPASRCGRTYIYLQTHFYMPTSMHAFEQMRAPIMLLSHQYRLCTMVLSLNTDSSGRRPASCQVHDATTHINRNSRPKNTGQAAGPDCYFQG